MDKKTILIFITVFVSSLILDSIGHLVIAGEFLSKLVADVSKPMSQVNPLPIMVEYLLVSFGIVYFLRQTGAFQKPVSFAAFVGGLIGLMVYGISGIINSTFLINWPWLVTAINTIIGVVVLSLAAVLGRSVGGSSKE